jgi:hypothetical protein
MKDKLNDLNVHLFCALERLNDEDLQDAETIAREIRRAGAVVGLAGQIIDVGRLALEATRVREQVGQDLGMPKVLGLDGSGGSR